MNKYYTPEIEEFHVGFRYQYLKYEEWIDHDLDGNSIDHPELEEFSDDLMKLAHAIVRVKYLDQSDIEELGWVLESSGAYSLSSMKGYEIEYEGYFTQRVRIYSYGDSNFPIFDGKVKNYNELERLMKQIEL